MIGESSNDRASTSAVTRICANCSGAISTVPTPGQLTGRTSSVLDRRSAVVPGVAEADTTRLREDGKAVRPGTDGNPLDERTRLRVHHVHRAAVPARHPE